MLYERMSISGSFCRRAVVLAGFLGVWATSVSHAQVFRNAEVREVIRSVESSTDYRFLFRDALIAGHTVSVSLDQDPISAVSSALEGLGLGVRVDSDRFQILIYRSAESGRAPEEVRIAGHVVDAATGSRLPYATVSWIDNAGNLRGVACNEAGYFDTRLQDGDSKSITFSYLGYESTSVDVPALQGSSEIDVRLKARPLMASEVVVSSTVLHTDLDTTWQHLIQPGVLAPLGEASVLRSLEALPSVSISAALSDGLTVRGSKADGFQVLLDGLPIYSRSHMFGLFDAFNEDALQTVGFYYGIAPPSYQAPPGGTVSFLTRTGNQEHLDGAFALSSTSVRGTAEGPLAGGKGSWLVSGRVAYLGQLDWFGNDDLIAQGLDVGRETSLDALGERPFETLNGDADYHDVHAKAFYETSYGGRLTLTAYTGGDQTVQTAERRVRLNNAFAGQNASAESNWGAGSIGLQYQRPYARSVFLNVVGGVTRYHSAFLNDSVVRVVRRNGQGGQNGQNVQRRLDTFSNDNELVQVRVSPEFTLARRGLFSIGADLNIFDVTYQEMTRDRPEFAVSGQATQLDFFAGYTSKRFGPFRYQLGMRSHYYSLGGHLRVSPRAEVRLGEGVASASLGYSRNHQFLHQLEVQPVQESAPDVWIMSSERESPGSVDYLTAGVYLRPNASVFLQVEGFLKQYSNLRLHETANPDPRGISLQNEINNPWLSEIDGEAWGVEVMVRHRTGPVVWSHSYARSKTVYRNPRVLDGREFAVSWDRTHQYTATAETGWGPVAAHANWSIATGTPNALSFVSSSESERLPVYHRLDLGISTEHRVGSRTLTAGISIFNAYNRDNVWYRTLVPTAVSGPPDSRNVDATLPVDVYDLGFHPSFELGIRF